VHILILPSTFDCLNIGDIAMLQACVARLTVLWPSATIQVLTANEGKLISYCPTVKPLAYGGWFGDHYMLGSLHHRLPRGLSTRLVRLKRHVLRLQPALSEAVIRLRARRDGGQFETFLQAIERADLVLVTGAGTLTDKFWTQAVVFLHTLEKAARLGKAVAMLGQGLGPIHDKNLLAKVAAVLPKVGFIALREARRGIPLIGSLGVSKSRVLTTGDEAIEMAYQSRPEKRGNGIGVNMRIAPAADVDQAVAQRIRPVLHEFARSHQAPLIPIPIALQEDLDATTNRMLMKGYDDASDGGKGLDTPLKVIDQVGRCRILVTGAYHAAVFALSQGIPAVCLAKSEYFQDKFLGLRNGLTIGPVHWHRHLAGPVPVSCPTVPVWSIDRSEWLLFARDRIVQASLAREHQSCLTTACQ
jgi:polysaccharide pyruvyl transferase WcaK-like protein